MKIILFGLIALMLVSSAIATNVNCNRKLIVHAIDQDGNNLSGVVVAPEWKTSFSGWNDFIPQERTTDSVGIATSNSWITVKGVFYQVNYATIDGYTCTNKEQTRITANKCDNVLNTVCTSDNQVPEFTSIGALIALVGAGIVIIRKRK